MTTYCCRPGNPVPHDQQLINHVVDCKATNQPDEIFAEFPTSPTSYDEGFTKVTYAKLANAIDKTAWWLVDTVGRGQNCPTIAYIGLNDLSYPALMLGAVKAGYKTLLLSPRSPVESQLHLLRATNCKIFAVSEPCPPPATAIMKALDESYKVLTVPSMDELLLPTSKPFPYNVSVAEAKNVPLVVIHTSGSTGLPKPITWPQSSFLAYGKSMYLTPPEGYENKDLRQGKRMFVMFPPFHAAGILFGSWKQILLDKVSIFPPKATLPSVDSLIQCTRKTTVHTASVVPSVIDELSRSPQALEEIASRVDSLVYAGGDVPQACGDIVTKRIVIFRDYGTSEAMDTPQILPAGEVDRELWKYFRFHPDAGVEFRHHSNDQYECYHVRQPDSGAHQPLFGTFPDIDEYQTHDLFRKHPTFPNLWSYCGRTDDLIILSNGLKVIPVAAEQSISSQEKEVSGVLLVGTQRDQTALLVELSSYKDITDADQKMLIDRLWPSVEAANKILPRQGQIARTHIMLMDANRPMSRTPKGTLQRKATLAHYAQDIDTLYAAADGLDDAAEPSAGCHVSDKTSVLRHLRESVKTHIGHDVDDDDNFFMQGMDSLQAVLLLREIKRGIKSVHSPDTRMIYLNPTINSLADALQETNSKPTRPQLTRKASTEGEIESTIRKYSKMIDQIQPRKSTNVPREKSSPVYLLTGSTGGLGSIILETLLASDASHIYCLDRPNKKRTQKHRLSKNTSADRVTFLVVDTAKPLFGLDVDIYQRLSATVTHIIHNAWQVNFNHSLSAFAAQLQGVVNLIKLAAEATRSPSMLYLSSISAVSDSHRSNIPEEVMTDPAIVSSLGYGASKFIAEHLVDHAAEKLKLNAGIARLGQIAGSLGSSKPWNKAEWFPSLVRSSAEIGMLPASLGADMDQVEWIPSDTTATVLVELVSGNSQHDTGLTNGHSTSLSQNGRARVFNLVNPRTVLWKKLCPSVAKALSSKRNPKTGTSSQIQVVPFDIWIEAVETKFKTDQKILEENKPTNVNLASEMEKILASSPAVKLVDFYNEQARNSKINTWDTANSKMSSRTFREMEGIKAEWIEKWMPDWL